MNDSLTPEQRSDWNSFVDYSDNQKQPVSPELLNGYKKLNPDSSLTTDHMPVATNEVAAIKGGKPIGGMTPAGASYIHSGLNQNYVNNPGNIRYPVSPTHGTHLEAHVSDSDTGGDPNKITLDDPRTISGATGLKIEKGQSSGTYNVDTIRNLIKASRHVGVDPSTAIAIALQESKLGNKTPDNLGNMSVGYNKTPQGLEPQSYALAAFLKEKMEEGKKLGYKDEAHLIQMYNGMGKLKPNMSVNGVLQPMKYYGLTVDKNHFLDLKKNPLYGKTIQDLRENVIKKNPRIAKLLKEA